MTARDKIRKLEQEKKVLTNSLAELDLAYHNNLLTPQDYLDKKHRMLGGRFEEDVLVELDNEINRFESSKKLSSRATTVLLVFALMASFFYIGNEGFTGITGLATFNQDGSVTLSINENYTANTTKDLSFITATSLKASGKVYGYGEAWIYLDSGTERRLIYYTDTRVQSRITGFAVSQPQGTPGNAVLVNNTNSTGNNTSSETNSIVNQTANNSVTNSTNSSAVTSNINNTTNSTNNTNNNVVNQTNSSLQNSTNSTVQFQILTDKSVYDIGETASIIILPADATYTLYITTPTNTYFLNEPYWEILEYGEHRLSALVTRGNQTDRISTTFYVTGPLDEQTGTFNQTCVETCTMSETDVTLVIVVNNVRVELDEITYVSVVQTINNTQNTTNGTANVTSRAALPQQILKTVNARPKKTKDERDCLQRNPNARPAFCFTAEEKQNVFPNKHFSLVNVKGKRMAVFNGNGDMSIKGVLIENVVGQPQKHDLLIKGANGNFVAWIDVLTGDLYLTGQVIENQETMMWQHKKDYVVSNHAGMYLGIFDAGTGDLYLRGTLLEGGLG